MFDQWSDRISPFRMAVSNARYKANPTHCEGVFGSFLPSQSRQVMRRLRSSSETRCVRGRGLRGFVTSEQGLKVIPICHSFMAKVNTLDSRQSSRFTVDAATLRRRLFRQSAMSGPVIEVMGR